MNASLRTKKMARLSAMFVFLALTSTAHATVLTVGSDASWKLSTVTTSGGTGGVWTNPTLAPPDASTFTESVTVGGGIVGLGGAAALGVTGITALDSGVSYFRQTFELPSFSSIIASVAAAVDNDIAVWINGIFIAAEADLDIGDAWLPPYPSFDILADGTIDNTVEFDLTTTSFTGFSSGTNELVLAIRNLDDTDTGGFAFRMDMDIETVPEPATTALLAIGLLGMGFARRRVH